jgi:voltage-gated potassium channel
MPFLHQVIVAAVLIILTLSVQSAGMAAFVVWVRGYFARNTSRFGVVHSAHLMVRVTTVMLTLQLLEILLWAGFYRWKCFSTWDAAIYFSVTTYSSVGYGDLLLPREWRMLGPIETVIGVLMCGLSTSGLFAIVSRLVRHDELFLPQVPLVSEPADSHLKATTRARETEASA